MCSSGSALSTHECTVVCLEGLCPAASLTEQAHQGFQASPHCWPGLSLCLLITVSLLTMSDVSSQFPHNACHAPSFPRQLCCSITELLQQAMHISHWVAAKSSCKCLRTCDNFPAKLHHPVRIGMLRLLCHRTYITVCCDRLPRVASLLLWLAVSLQMTISQSMRSTNRR